MFEIVRYTRDQASQWNQFIGLSKNGTFLFDRNYMDYHHDRFQDHSLMVFRRGRLYAVLPANAQDRTLWTHRGLTYGGLVLDEHARTAEVRDVFSLLNDYLRQQGFRQVIYKHVPAVYTSLPSDEDLFALSNVCHATLRTRDVASVVCLQHRLPFSTLRKRGVRKALHHGVVISESNDLAAYWLLLEETLRLRHHATPVHCLQEITLLRSRFPHHIRLFVAEHNRQLLGGCLLYINKQTVKTQYIAANEDGRHCGALDLLFQHLLQQFSEDGMQYFDFGTSNLVENDDLNDSLIHQKEGFGGRAVCYDTYEWSV